MSISNATHNEHNPTAKITKPDYQVLLILALIGKDLLCSHPVYIGTNRPVLAACQKWTKLGYTQLKLLNT